MQTALNHEVATVLVVDDEPLARKRLVSMIAALSEYEVIGEAENGEQAQRRCEELQPDIVLMDIRMPGVDGLQAASELAQQVQPPALIFCTAYDEHALAAFEAGAIDYLLKPVKRAQLATSLGRATALNRAQMLRLQRALHGDAETGREFVLTRTAKGEERVAVDDIRAFIADKKYVSAYLPSREVILDVSLKSLEEEYAGTFVRIHRNALVAKKYIVSLEKVSVSSHGKSDAMKQRGASAAGEPLLCVKLADIDLRPRVSRRLAPSVRRFIRRH